MTIRMTAYKFMKRTLDVTAALLLIIITALPMIIVALFIKFNSRGSVFYRGDRLGLNNAVFKQIKFRTMVENAADLRNPDGSTLSTIADPRVTKIGKILRQTSLDELPQLFNVLVGDMSLVGPRPDPVDAVVHYRSNDFQRLNVKPGLTGWAQIHGRNSIPWEERRNLDLQYVKDRTFFLDIKILILTAPLLLTGKGIHTPESLDNGGRK